MLCTQGLGYLVGIIFVKQEQIGLVIGMMIYINFCMFSNFYIAIKEIPEILQLFSSISFPNFIYNTNLIILYGLDRCSLDQSSLILYKIGLNDQQLWFNLEYLFVYTIVLRIFALIILYVKTNRFFNIKKTKKFSDIDFEIIKNDKKGNKILNQTSLKINYSNKFKEEKTSYQEFEKSDKNMNKNLSIAWIDLTLKQEKNLFSEEKIILKQLNGCIEFGTLNALMGPSGAGKTSLLKCLHGRNI